MVTERDLEIAPCLRAGPLCEAGREVVEAARALGESPLASVRRAWTVPFLYDGLTRVLANDEDPLPQLLELLDRLTKVLLAEQQAQWGDLAGSGGVSPRPRQDQDVESQTGDHFSHLFTEFSTETFWKEPIEKLRTRLERNDVSAKIFADQEVLDAGSGSGRMSITLRKLGARRVTGIDISERNVSLATRQAEATGIEGVSFEVGSVLELPYSDESYDLVFSFGVLHHTVDWQRGIAEMMRVLRPGGTGLIMYLNEEPGGLFWDVLEILRVIVADEDYSVARRAIELLGIAPERIIQMLDPAMVPINVRLSPAEIENCLSDYGARDIRRFTRGGDTDRLERVYQGRPFAAEKFGIGENRYIFRK